MKPPVFVETLGFCTDFTLLWDASVYNPNNGDLVVDLFTHQRNTRSLLVDAYGGPAIAIGGGIEEPTAIDTSISAPIMRLTYAPIPESRAILILFVGAFFMWFAKRKPK